jgi:predicted nucleic acid-binding protein
VRDSRTSPLPDFYIGAHAAIGGLEPLTRDAARYRSYFPKVEILVPTKRGM